MKESFENIKYFELIQKYFDGEMNSDEISSFKILIYENEELNKEYILYKELEEGIRKFKANKLISKFNEIDNELDQIQLKSKIRRINYKLFSVAASIVIIIGILFYFNISSVSLTDKYWEEDRGIPLFMSNSKDFKMNEAMKLYNEQKYNEVAEIFDEIRSLDKGKDTLNYYTGIVEYKRKNYTLSIKYFKEVLLIRSSVYFEKAEYRLCLCYITNENLQQANSLLVKISNSKNHLYKEQAKQLLKELHKNK